MRKQIASLALTAMFGLGVAIAAPQNAAPQDQPAQNGHWAGRRQADPQKEVQHLTKKLNLTSDQQSQILSILQNRQQQMEQLRNDSSLSQDDRRAKFRSIREDSETKIHAVLNDTQKKQYDDMQQQMREHREQHANQNPQ